MPHPTDDQLDALASGDLTLEADVGLRDHLSTCSRCQEALRQLCSLYSALHQQINDELCPSDDVLVEAVQNSFDEARFFVVNRHLRRCARCTNRVELICLSVSGANVIPADDKTEFIGAVVEARGKEVAQRALQLLMPEYVILFDQLWPRVTSLVNRLRSQSMQAWPGYANRREYAEALGFIGGTQAEVAAATAILGTALWSLWDAAEGRSTPASTDFSSGVHRTARRFQAGEQLATRLAESMGDLLSQV